MFFQGGRNRDSCRTRSVGGCERQGRPEFERRNFLISSGARGSRIAPLRIGSDGEGPSRMAGGRSMFGLAAPQSQLSISRNLFDSVGWA